MRRLITCLLFAATLSHAKQPEQGKPSEALKSKSPDIINIDDLPSELDVIIADAKKGTPEAQSQLGLAYLSGSRGANKNEAEAVSWLRKAAEQGHASAQNSLGVCYLEGRGLKKDEGEAVKWYIKAANQGEPLAEANLGDCYAYGMGIGKDPEVAFSWYLKSANHGYAQGQFNAGMCLKQGTGTAKNMPEALAWFKKSADQNNAQSQFELGMSHWDGLAADQDYAAAFAWFIKSANQGLAVGQAMTGFCYQTGYGINKNQTLAASWYLKSAEQGNPIAQVYYGKMLLNGHGTEAEQKAAREWIKKSADQGYTEAEASFSLILYNEKNYQLALQYGQRAAAKGDAIGQFAQGICLLYSKVENERSEGKRLVTMSAEQGFAFAQVTLGKLCLLGFNNEGKNAQEAVKWFKRAADQGDGDAQFAMSGCYYNGDGVIKDEIEAYAFLNLSGVTNPKARELLKDFETLLSTEARLVGQQRAKQLQKEIESRKASTEGRAETFQQLLKEIERERAKKGA